MNWRELQHKPPVFWTLAFLAVAGPVWTYYNDRASREISYFLDTKNLVDVEDFGSSDVTINGQRVTEGTIYINRLYIWNSGNTDLLSDDFGEPIQWSNAPATIQWSELPIKTDIQQQGLAKDQIEGNLLPGPTESGLRFKKMYAGSVVIATFLTKSKPDISLSGSVNSADTGSGIIKRQKISFWDLKIYFLVLWIIVFLSLLKLIWDKNDQSYFYKFWNAAMLSIGPVFGVWFAVDMYANLGLPPF